MVFAGSEAALPCEVDENATDVLSWAGRFVSGRSERNTVEFEGRVAREAACRKYLVRWPDGFRCPKCGDAKAWPVRTVLLQCAACGRQTSVAAGTIFQDTRTSLPTWFRAMWWVSSQKTGASAKGLQQVLGLGSYETAWTLLHTLRRAMVRPGRDRLEKRGYRHCITFLKWQKASAAEWLPRVHRVVSLLKRWLLGTPSRCPHACSSGLLPRRAHVPVQPADVVAPR